jgi:arylsulfatase A-like enzyme
VLVTVDCLRADAFRPDAMPNLAALASRGAVFTRLYAGATHTRASMPLVLRGSNGAEPVARILGRHGVTTSAVFAWGDVTDMPTALGAGFATLRAPVRGSRWSARETTDVALAELARVGDATPQLLWVHYFDAHEPLIAPPRGTPAFADPRPGFADYLAELAYVDAQVKRLLDAVDAGPARDRTAILLSADHGEAFGLHGLRFHGVGGYETVTHVPGVLVAPGVPPMRYDGVASHRDVPATVLGAFGLSAREPQAETFGRSWFRVRGGDGAPLHRFVVTRSNGRTSSSAETALPMASLVEGNMKLIETFEDQLVELYDVVGDPRELEDLAPTREADVARLRAELALYRDIDGPP